MKLIVDEVIETRGYEVGGGGWLFNVVIVYIFLYSSWLSRNEI